MMFSTIKRELVDNFAQSIDFAKVSAVGKTTTLSDRLKEIALFYNLSMAEFGRKLSCPPATMHGYLNENREPKLSFFQEFEKAFPNVNISWVISGKGDMLSKNSYINDLENEINIVQEQLALYKSMFKLKEENEALKSKKN